MTTANLGYIAPMPIADVCTPIHSTVYYAYKNWPKEFDNATNPTKILRGTKCPRGELKSTQSYVKTKMESDLDILHFVEKLSVGWMNSRLTYQRQ